MKSLKNIFYFSSVNKSGLKILALGFAAIASMTGCSDGNDKTAGGGPSGTEAGNAITASFVDGGTPVARAKVNLIESESLGFGTTGESSYTTNTDENGFVEFNGVPKGSYTLEARTDGKAIQIPVEVENDNSIDLGQKQLEETASVTGSVGTAASGTIKLRGLDYKTTVENGKFKLESLPAGPISMVFIPSENGDTTSAYLNTASGKSSNAVSFASESKSLLLEDFEDGDYQHRFMPAHTYDGGWWYFSYEHANVKASYIDSLQHFAIEDDNGNKVAHVGAEFGEIISDSAQNIHIYPWATIGIEIGKSDSSYCNDISSVDSVTFRIKSTVNMVFAGIDKTRPSEDNQNEVFRFEIAQYADWTKVSVPLNEIAKTSDLTCVTQFNWLFKTSGEVWLDDIELVGGDRLSIWER